MDLCSFEECGRKRSARGWCKVHYNMWKLTGEVHKIGSVGRGGAGRNKGEIRLCSFEGCDLKHEAKGYCKPHWRQHHAGIPLTPVGEKRIRNKGNCNAKECDQTARAQGYCLKHYARLKNTGTTELISLSKRKYSIHCTVDNCGTPSRLKGYCHKHYREFVLQVDCKPRGGHNKNPPIPCCINNCEGFAKKKGMCNKHYSRVRRHDDPGVNYHRKYKSKPPTIPMNKDNHYYMSNDDRECLDEFFHETVGTNEGENIYCYE